MSIIRQSTQDYQAENDPLAQFIFDECEELQGKKIKTTELYLAYVLWAKKEGFPDVEIMSRKKFTPLMRMKYATKPIGGFYYYINISLKKRVSFLVVSNGESNSGNFEAVVNEKNKSVVSPPYERKVFELLSNDKNDSPQPQNLKLSFTKGQNNTIQKNTPQPDESNPTEPDKNSIGLEHNADYTILVVKEKN